LVLRLKHNVLKKYYFFLTDAGLAMLAVWLMGFLNQVTRHRLDEKYLTFNRAGRTVTSLIGSDALPLNHATNPSGLAAVFNKTF